MLATVMTKCVYTLGKTAKVLLLVGRVQFRIIPFEGFITHFNH